MRQGSARVRAAWFPILQASVAAAIAFAIARYAVGHPYPFFAPVSAWVALGFTTDRSVRRVAELAVGVAIGVALGDLLVHLIGNGAWQVAVVLFLAAIIARFIDRGADAHHAGRRAGAGHRGPARDHRVRRAARAVDRRRDRRCGRARGRAAHPARPASAPPHAGPRRRPRTSPGVLRILARGLRTGRRADVEDALVRGPGVAAGARRVVRDRDERAASWPACPRPSASTARSWPGSPPTRCSSTARCATPACWPGAAWRPSRRRPHDMTTVAAQVEATARATDDLAAALGAGRDPERARTQLLAVSGALDPFRLAAARLAGAEPGAAAPLAGRRPARGGGRRAAGRPRLPPGDLTRGRGGFGTVAAWTSRSARCAQSSGSGSRPRAPGRTW